MCEPAVGHGLDHDVHVAGVVEVAVADHDRVQRREVDLALRVRDHGAGSWIEADPGLAVFEKETARRGDLLRDHEPGAGGPHEGQSHVSATSESATSDFSPK